MAVKLKGKGEKFETLYIRDAELHWAFLTKPTKGYDGSTEYQATVFVSAEDAEALQMDVGLNKELSEVGVTKIKKGKNRGNIKFPEDKYPAGMFGLNISMPEVSKQGNKLEVNVVDTEGNLIKDAIGNGTKANIKLSGYRNQEDSLCLTMIQLVQVTDLVEYESSGGGDSIYDEEFGVSIKKSGGNDFDDDFEDDDNPFS